MIITNKTFELANRLLRDSCNGECQPASAQRMRLLCPKGGAATWMSGAMPVLPATVRPLLENEEKILVSSIISDICGGLAIDLNPAPTFERGVGQVVVRTEGSCYLVIGSSNAARLHQAMVDRKLVSRLVSLGHWRVLAGTVDNLCQKLPAIIEEYNPTTVVLQLLDNSVFYALQEDGSLIPARRLGDAFHVDGDLVFGDKRTLQKVLDLCKQLFRSFSGRKLIVVTCHNT
jgi:hypothetical protein